MAYQGTRLSIEALIAISSASGDSDAPAPMSSIGVRHTAHGNARHCAELLEAGEPVSSGWRFGILQTLDDYRSTVKRGGVQLGAGVFADAPEPTGSAELDTAFAALAEYLADRDGWAVPSWAAARGRLQAYWYPDVPDIFREEAKESSPPAFRSRGIFITDRSLSRA